MDFLLSTIDKGGENEKYDNKGAVVRRLPTSLQHTLMYILTSSDAMSSRNEKPSSSVFCIINEVCIYC